MWNDAAHIEYEIEDLHRYDSNLPGWTADPSRAALVVHDMQAYFLERFKSDTDPVTTLKKNAVALVKSARSLGVPVFYTAQPGSMTPTQRGLLSAFWGEGMRARPEHRNVWEPIAPVADSEKITKWRYSAFFGNDLGQQFERLNIRQVILMGIYGHVGILGTAVEAYSRDYETFVVADAIADFSKDEHIRTLIQVADTCATVCSTAEITDSLRKTLKP